MRDLARREKLIKEKEELENEIFHIQIKDNSSSGWDRILKIDLRLFQIKDELKEIEDVNWGV